MSRTNRNPIPALEMYLIRGEEIQTKQVRGQGPGGVITMKAGLRVGDHTVGASKSKRVRQWKRIAKRRASKRRRQEVACAAE